MHAVRYFAGTASVVDVLPLRFGEQAADGIVVDPFDKLTGVMRVKSFGPVERQHWHAMKEGMLIYETDTNTLHIRAGGEWQEWGLVKGVPGRQMRFPWATN